MTQRAKTYPVEGTLERKYFKNLLRNRKDSINTGIAVLEKNI